MLLTIPMSHCFCSPLSHDHSRRDPCPTLYWINRRKMITFCIYVIITKYVSFGVTYRKALVGVRRASISIENHNRFTILRLRPWLHTHTQGPRPNTCQRLKFRGNKRHAVSGGGILGLFLTRKFYSQSSSIAATVV